MNILILLFLVNQSKPNWYQFCSKIVLHLELVSEEESLFVYVLSISIFRVPQKIS